MIYWIGRVSRLFFCSLLLCMAPVDDRPHWDAKGASHLSSATVWLLLGVVVYGHVETNGGPFS